MLQSSTTNPALNARICFLETRPQFLLLPVVLVFLASAMALNAGRVDLLDAFLACAGLLLLHASVNVLNDYHDFQTGIDQRTRRTPFSGGSGLLPAGRLRAGQALLLGRLCFASAVPIAVYFLLAKGFSLLPLFLVGAFFVVGYTPVLTRVGMGAGEIAAGLGLGTLPVAGTYFILTGTLTAEALYASVPSGFLVLNLLLLNELPDVEADRFGGRRTLPIVLGVRKAAWVYGVVSVGVYVWIAAGVLLGLMPAWTLLGCLTLPAAVRAIRGSFVAPEQPERLLPALGANVFVVLATQAAIAFGYLLAAAR